MSGQDTVEQAIKVVKDIKLILQKGGFRLQKWASNSSKFLEQFDAEQHSKQVKIDMKLQGTALLGYGEDVNSAQWLCGGSIISERFILTAAHCSSTHRLGQISYAALGLLKRDDPSEFWKIYKIKRIIAHPEYRAPSKYNDIALLETKDEINFGRNILPACLDVGGDRTWFEASGWGRLGDNKDLANTLQVVGIETFSKEECAALYPPHRLMRNGYNHTTQMCLGRRDEIVDTCEGDSGGPLQYDLYQNRCVFHIAGVTSFGTSCGILGSAGIYTRVSHYVPWIESVVWPEETEAIIKEYNQILYELISSS
uniref:Peptidase S1 domain-containing protein n=1 Tax=Heliothis virescens TaxID=7102 RepID=A0A2A4K9I3_HELVI